MPNLAVIGSTGSIGRNALAIAAQFPDRFRILTLAAKSSVDELARQVKRFDPDIAAVFDADCARRLEARLPAGSRAEVVYGADGYRRAAAHAPVDLVVSAAVGAAGLAPTLAAVGAGKDVALANKESLVMAGELVMARVAERGVRLLPVDSEHSAIFQCLAGNRRRDLRRILLTASGGPLRKQPRSSFARITPRQALQHPNWQMGPKITIDSATLMNKGLEVIEARWLFDVSLEQIEVVIHPQSIVHSMVAFQDGSVMAQLGIPDMKAAIAYALACPERLPLGLPLPGLTAPGGLTFEEPDTDRFPCLKLALHAGGVGGTLPAVLNAANEAAVEAFLAEELAFDRIAEVIGRVMARHRPVAKPDLSAILQADGWARRQAADEISALTPHPSHPGDR